MKFAIEVAMAELTNSGEWADHITEEEVDKVYVGMKQLEDLLEE